MISRLLIINVHYSIKKLALKASFFLLSAGIATTITQETILRSPYHTNYTNKLQEKGQKSTLDNLNINGISHNFADKPDWTENGNRVEFQDK